MKSLESLSKMYEKEKQLAERHKAKAQSIKEEMDLIQNKQISKRIHALNLTAEEFRELSSLLDSKKTLQEAIHILKSRNAAIEDNSNQNQAEEQGQRE